MRTDDCRFRCRRQTGDQPEIGRRRDRPEGDFGVVCAGDGSVSEDDDYPGSIVSRERNLLISLSSAC